MMTMTPDAAAATTAAVTNFSQFTAEITFILLCKSIYNTQTHMQHTHVHTYIYTSMYSYNCTFTYL